MAAAERIPFITPEEYLERERLAEFKSEYLSGRIYAMAGASRAHNTITFNLITALGFQLRGRPCQGFAADMRVRVSHAGLYTYPDVVVICGEPVFLDDREDTLLNPTLIIEVLSDSTEAYDRGEKFAQYERLDSLREYVLVTQKRPRIERFLRQDDGTWNRAAVEGLEAKLDLASIGCGLILADVYDRVPFGPAAAGNEEAGSV